MTGHSTETEIGGKEWKVADVTGPHCHLANLYQESAFESGIPRKAGASGSTLYRHLANSLARRGKVTVERSSKWRKIMPGSWPGSRFDPACWIRLAPFINLPPIAVISRDNSKSARHTRLADLGEIGRASCRERV